MSIQRQFVETAAGWFLAFLQILMLKTGGASELLQENKANQLQVSAAPSTAQSHSLNSAAKTLLDNHKEIG